MITVRVVRGDGRTGHTGNRWHFSAGPGKQFSQRNQHENNDKLIAVENDCNEYIKSLIWTVSQFHPTGQSRTIVA